MHKAKYLALIEPAITLVEHKGDDYNNTIRLEEYFPFGDASYQQMIHMKVLRMRSVLNKGSAPNYDSVLDSLYDLMNYAVFYIDYINQKDKL